jgi:hypothetical protein
LPATIGVTKAGLCRAILIINAASAPPPIFDFHPNIADSYRKKVQDLGAALAACDEEDRVDATAAIRELVEKVTIMSNSRFTAA